MNRGYFIAVEGCDHSGKTTLVARLERHLIKEGHDVLVVRQPGGTELAEELRASAKKKRTTEVSSVTEYLIMMAARSDLVHNVIKPALAEGKVVITDRHDGSTYAYQDMVIPAVSEVASIEPDITLFIDRDPTGASYVQEDRGEECRIEDKGISFQKEVYDRYIDFIAIRPEPVIRIDVNGGFDVPSYGIGLMETCHAVAHTKKYLRVLKGLVGVNQFTQYFFDKTNIGIIPVGSPVDFVPTYDEFDVNEDSTDEEIDAEVRKYLGSCHKWKRGKRPIRPISATAPHVSMTGVKDSSV